MTCHDPRTTVVVITRNRRDGLLRTLRAPAALPERPPVVVVDSASTDGAADAVARHRPEVALLRPGRNPGAVGRDPAVRRAGAGVRGGAGGAAAGAAGAPGRPSGGRGAVEGAVPGAALVEGAAVRGLRRVPVRG